MNTTLTRPDVMLSATDFLPEPGQLLDLTVFGHPGFEGFWNPEIGLFLTYYGNAAYYGPLVVRWSYKKPSKS